MPSNMYYRRITNEYKRFNRTLLICNDSPFYNNGNRKEVTMSEIEKMYMRCKIKKQQTCSHSDTCYNGSLDECEGCKAYQYPPFTAEKQLEIVKMILFSTWWMNLKRLQFSEKFDEGLAQMINELWQDLTEEEKQQVKGILE